MVFIAEAFAGWLLGQLADAGREGLGGWLLGSDQERALRQAANAAIHATAREFRPGPAPADDAQGSDHLARVIDHVFQQAPSPAESLVGQDTLLLGLQARVAGRLAVLGEVDITGTGQSSAELLSVRVPAVTEALTRHLVREILLGGAGGGPLTPLAAQLNHDLTHLQGQQHTMSLLRLTGELQAVLANPGRRNQHREPSPVRAAPRLGRPIDEVTDPFALEVHRAITGPDRSAPLPALPAYVERDHDPELKAVVKQAVDGRSAAAVLVGGSSTGKTRACWEAVQRLPQDWRLWHPIDPSRPEAAVDAIQAVGPRTVVWLNEAQHYLFTPASRLGERIAAGLRELLRDPDRGPVLVLGTIWPEYWATLTTPPGPGQRDDPHAQARALLTGTDISVPDAFTGPALQAVQLAAKADPRLADAVAHAHDGRITQFLAGVPALLERYRNAPAAARALIEAAMDARRLGHGLYLPLDLLEVAAPGYLTDQQWDALDDDWLEHALAFCAAPSRGAPGPLTRVRVRPGQPTPAQERLRLADYLEQASRARRGTVLAPAALWDGFVHHADHQDLPRIAREAEARSLRRHALQLHQRAADTGDFNALRQAAELLRWTDHVDQAVGLYQRAAEAGAPYALGEAARLLDNAGRLDEAIVLYQNDAEAGYPFARWRAADLLASIGRLDQAIEWLQRRPGAADDHGTRRQAAELLAQAGHSDEAIGLYQRAADAGDPYGSGRAAQLLQEAGRTEEAVSWLQARAANSGDRQARRQAAQLLKQLRRQARVTGLRQPAAEARRPDALGQAAELLVEAGRIDLAIGLYQRVAQAGDRSALWRAAELLERAGQLEAALVWYQRHAEAGDYYAVGRAAALLQQTGRLDAAIDWLRTRGVDVGDRHALGQAATLLQEAGRLGDAVDLCKYAAEAGDRDALQLGTRFLYEAGRRDDAIAWLYAHAAEVGDPIALGWAADLLRDAGRLDQAIDWYRHAAEAGNRTALWQVTKLLQEGGRLEDTIGRYLRAAEAGDRDALGHAAQLLQEAGRAKEAIGLYLRAAEAGDSYALSYAANLLERAGRRSEATDLRRYGLEPGGRIASRWR
jgi:tetratricopeptide (TPR) repeat protein